MSGENKRCGAFHFLPAFLLLLPSMLAGQEVVPGRSLGPGWQIIDFVDIPPRYTASLETGLYVEFTEYWNVNSERAFIQKEVARWDPHLSSRPEGSRSTPEADSLMSRVISLLPETREDLRILEISYEFHLLDPHVAGSANRSFSTPDSMDAQTRELQRALARLAGSRIPRADRMELESRMLSVIFHERWIIDPDNRQITKEVEAITPVLWQRRQTAGGTPLDEPDTGLPVYFKNNLQRIYLRNP